MKEIDLLVVRKISIMQDMTCTIRVRWRKYQYINRLLVNVYDSSIRLKTPNGIVGISLNPSALPKWTCIMHCDVHL